MKRRAMRYPAQLVSANEMNHLSWATEADEQTVSTEKSRYFIQAGWRAGVVGLACRLAGFRLDRRAGRAGNKGYLILCR